MVLRQLCALALALATSIGAARAETVLRFVPHSDLKILDPVWTTAYVTRNHGFMVYDTLFALDAAGEIRPQMVEGYSVTPDGLTYRFTLREGLVWHDGLPVTAEDCVASLQRWAARDVMGQKLLTFVADMTPTSAREFRVRLKEPTGLLLQSMAKPSSSPAFMMPKRVAMTEPTTQITDYTGSGPFMFRKDLWQPGAKVVYERFRDYRPRAEPPSGLAGGKVAKVDKVVWLPISDHQQAINALLANEVDYIEAPPHDLYPLVKSDPATRLIDWNPLGSQYNFRFNTLHKPFDDPRVRQALLYAFDQEQFLRAVVGDPHYYKVCKAMFICGTPLATEIGMEDKLNGDIAKARALLADANYDGTPIVLLHSTDVQVLANLAPVAKALMEKAGFKVDLQSMDWQTLVARRAKKDPPSKGGWHAYLTTSASSDLLNPVTTSFLNTACDGAAFGWPCDARIEQLRDAFARASASSVQKSLVEALQQRVVEYPTHVHLGQWYGPGAARKSVQGIVPAPVPVLWNVSVD